MTEATLLQLAVGGVASTTAFGTLDLCLSATGGPSGKIIRLQQAELDAGIGPVSGYVYKEDFLMVKWGVGAWANIGHAIIGAEREDGGTSVAYAKYRIGTPEAFIRPMVGVIAWDGLAIKKVVAEIRVQANIGNCPVYLRALQGFLLSDGSQSIRVQAGVNYPL